MKLLFVPEAGKKNIGYQITGNSIDFNNEISLNLETREREYNINVDICIDKSRSLVCGTAVGLKYVAQIFIPARKFNEIIGEPDSEGNPTLTIEPVRFNIDNCTLTLWEMED